ncbi:hypothetical protein KBY82_02820 [Cyanobium sp. AMD-g]|uniref:hypothetical protein n=1 Tax=Cyanobium sp. AMD-g TaxID=2823699 RepID=UPI0020CFE076|nr:hypothetical protein [Cyanobium sp. AMD-g]MCP9929712.1 hypothetical protein [Cyanobium sp. AMD-g]
MADPKTKLELLASTVQVVSVVSGVVISVLSFNSTRLKEAEARKVEAERPFLELRRKTYLDAVKTAAVLSTPEGRSAEELAKAKHRFRELYVAELTMVEDESVEQKMVSLAAAVDPDLRRLNQGQLAALELAKALRDSFTTHQVE